MGLATGQASSVGSWGQRDKVIQKDRSLAMAGLLRVAP